MWPALEELAEGSVGPGAEQVALAVAASTTWVAVRASLSAWLVAPGLVALREQAAAVSMAMEVVMVVVMEVAFVELEEWAVVMEGLVVLEGLVALVGLVAMALVSALGESRK